MILVQEKDSFDNGSRTATETSRFYSGLKNVCDAIWKKILLLIILVILCVIMLTSITDPMQPQRLVTISNDSDIYTPKYKHYSLRTRPKPYTLPKLPENDYNNLINITNFQFNIINQTICQTSDIFLLVLIISAPKNFHRRHTIRTTWGRHDPEVKTFFLLGAVQDSNLQKDIELESELHNDIVQGNFIDSYRNLTYKSVMALKYMVYHCSKATYILKTDDDVFIHMPLLKNYLIHDMSPYGAENYLHCHMMINGTVLRDPWYKWYVTKEEFADEYYPTYCNGAYILFSPDVLFKLYLAAQKTKFFVWEDVFLYGIAASKYPEIKHTDTRTLTLWQFEYTPQMLSTGYFDNTKFIIGPFGMNSEGIYEFWEYVINRPVPKSVYRNVTD